MNFLSVGAKLNREIDRKRSQLHKFNTIRGEWNADIGDVAERRVWEQFERDLDSGMRAWQMYQNKMAEIAGLGKWYSLTVSPASSVPFVTFYAAAQKFLSRNCVLEIAGVTFEQRGQTEDTAGTGFHLHAYIRCKQQKYAELARDARSTFKDSNVKCGVVTGDAKDVFARYCLRYESSDGHKEKTREMDALWRQRMGLENAYYGVPEARAQRSLTTSTKIEEVVF